MGDARPAGSVNRERFLKAGSHVVALTLLRAYATATNYGGALANIDKSPEPALKPGEKPGNNGSPDVKAILDYWGNQQVVFPFESSGIARPYTGS